MASRKTYQAVAAGFMVHRTRHAEPAARVALDDIARHIAGVFVNESATFDAPRFLVACGVIDG